MKKPIVIAVCVLLAGSAIVHAQRGTITRMEPTSQRLRAEPWRPPTGTGVTRVIGVVIDISQTPVKRARLQLRNLRNGSVMQEVESDDQGEYEFEVDEPGTYVVEMVMVDGYVVALSNAGALGRYETMNTVIQLPGRWQASSYTVAMPNDMTSFMGMSAQNTMTAQTLNIAVATNIATADPGLPVSP